MKKYIFVAGVDYHFNTNPRMDYRIYCENRVRFITQSNKTLGDVEFIIFDFCRGEQLKYEFSKAAGKLEKRVTPIIPSSPYKKITAECYEQKAKGSVIRYKFKEGQYNAMSILHVYSAIQQIGIDAPSTLAEFSIFSHSSMGGPILVNSDDDGLMTIPASLLGDLSIQLPEGLRDPSDMDARVLKDFVPPTMSATQLANFQKAFHPEGCIWIWGCNYPPQIHQILVTVERNPKYKPSGLVDEDEFIINDLSVENAYLIERVIIDELGEPFLNKKSFRIKFGHIKLFFYKMNLACYNATIARNVKMKTFGAVLGTYADYDKGILPLMHVYTGPPFPNHLRFYKNYLGFKFDTEGRNYGEFRP